MTVRISEDFDHPQGLFANYDSYDVGQRDAIQTQRHVDIRSFVQNDIASTPLTIADISTYTMTVLSVMTMDALAGGIAYGGEHWTVTGGGGTVVVGPQSDRKHWNGLALTYTVGLNTVSSVLLPPVDIDATFDGNDFISLAFPAFPIAKFTLGSCFVDFTSHPQGNFVSGPTASVAFNDAALIAPLVNGDTEMRFHRSALAGIDLSQITGVQFRIQATATGTDDFRCLAIRCLAKEWVYPPIEMNTRYHRLGLPVPLDGRASPTSAFPTAQSPVTSPLDWPMLFRSADPSGDDDPVPIDVSLGVPFYTGSISNSNTFSVFLREFPKDEMTMLNLDPSGGTVVTQDALNALGRQPDYDRAAWGARRQTDLDGLDQSLLDGMRQDALERVPNYLNASWMEIKITWASGGSTITFQDRNLNGYTQTITLAASTYYYLLCELEETGLRVRILASDGTGKMDFAHVIYDSAIVYDDLLCERRPGRVGWYGQFGDGDAFVSNLQVRHLSFGEYRSHAYRSITPVSGAQLAVECSPSNEFVTDVFPGPYGAALSVDNVKARSGRGWQITNPGSPNQGIQTNSFYVEDWDQISIDFDILFPSLPNATTVVGYLVGAFSRKVSIDLPPLTPDRWQHVHVLPFQGAANPTGRYSLVLYQPNADAGTWYLDALSIKERTVAWRARSAMPDPWGDTPTEWTDFRHLVNDGAFSGKFARRGDALQVSGRVVKQNAEIIKASAVPIYSELGRVTFDTPTVATPTASFTTSISSRTVSFDGTGSTTSIIAWEWSFGDGTVTSGPFPQHTYAATGTYAVTLTVHDKNDNVSSVIQNVTV